MMIVSPRMFALVFLSLIVQTHTQLLDGGKVMRVARILHGGDWNEVGGGDIQTRDVNNEDTGLGLSRDQYWGDTLFQELMDRSDGIPLLSTGEKVKTKMDWYNIGTIANTTDMITRAYTLAAKFEYGVYGRYPVIMTPHFTLDLIHEIFLSMCERTQSCIALSLYYTKQRCIPQINILAPQYGKMMPLDCVTSGKRLNQRRFDYGLGILYNQDTMASAFTTLYRAHGARTAAVIWSQNTDDMQGLIAYTFENLLASGYKIVLKYNYSGEIPMPSNDATNLALAQQLKEKNPDVVYIIAVVFHQYIEASIVNLFDKMKKINWVPKGIAMAGGLDSTVYRNVSDINDFRYMTAVSPAVWQATGPDYRSIASETNFELFSANEQFDSPMIALEYYLARYYNTSGIGGTKDEGAPSQGLLAIQANVIYAKLLELAGTDDADKLRLAATQISTPSLIGKLQFEPVGRLVDHEQFINQYGHEMEFALITPLSVGVPLIYPMPNWSERIFNPVWYSTRIEKTVAGLNTVVIIVLVLMIFGISYFQDHPVMKSASPVFCITMLFGGIVCLLSTYFASLHTTGVYCATSTWMLTTGFTLMFAALFAKNYRVYAITRQENLKTLRLNDNHLWSIIALVLLCDIIVNIVWHAAEGFHSETIVTDMYRPALNYVQCQFSSNAIIYAQVHIALKVTLIFMGVVLTILSRNVPSQYNETPYLGAAIYNVALLFVFAVPIVASGIGGRETTYGIRSFGIMFIILSTSLILFLPKFYLIANSGISNDIREPTGAGFATRASQLDPAHTYAPANIAGAQVGQVPSGSITSSMSAGTASLTPPSVIVVPAPADTITFHVATSPSSISEYELFLLKTELEQLRAEKRAGLFVSTATTGAARQTENIQIEMGRVQHPHAHNSQS